MAKLFKKTIVRYLDANGKRVAKDAPDARKVTEESSKWYGRISGKPDPVPLCSLKTAAQQMYNKLLGDAAKGSVGLADPFSEHHRRRLVEHLADFEAVLHADGAGEKHVQQTASYVRRIIEECGFVFTPDLSASRVQQFLFDLQKPVRTLPELEKGKEEYTPREAAAALRASVAAVGKLVRYHRLAATGKASARRLPRGTVDTLRTLRTTGKGVRTANLHLVAIKSFVHWMVKDERTGSNPLAYLSGGNDQKDRRHDRRALPLHELRAIVQAARESELIFRGLTGADRAILYSVAAASGFRVSELASLQPSAFQLDAAPPVVTLRADEAKNGQVAIQPLPTDVAEAMRSYLAGRPPHRPLWPSDWQNRAAEMLRIELDAVGIPYVVDGPNGPLYADFHALRHSFVALLDKAGVSLKQAMQLARHSDPKLTMARYGRAQLADLGAAVASLPALLTTDAPAPMHDIAQDLERINTAWPTLSASVRAAIVALVKDGSRKENGNPAATKVQQSA